MKLIRSDVWFPPGPAADRASSFGPLPLIDPVFLERTLAGREFLELSVAIDCFGDPISGRLGLEGGPVHLINSAKSRVDSLAGLASLAWKAFCFGGRLMRPAGDLGLDILGLGS